jgi:hypothetical protein
MILNELFYFDKNTLEMSQDGRYSPEDDSDVMEKSDTRKTRLTLEQINKLRAASDLHEQEKEQELEFIRQMYGLAAQQPVA